MQYGLGISASFLLNIKETSDEFAGIKGKAHTDHPHTWWSHVGQWEGQQPLHGLRECMLIRRVIWSVMPRV